MLNNRKLLQILICDDDSTFHLAVKHSLKKKFNCLSAYNGDEALAILRKSPIDVILLDVSMRTPDEGLVLIPKIRELDQDVAVVMSSSLTDFHTVREAMRLGAADYIPKDFHPDDLEHTIELALEKQALLKRRDQQNFELISSHQKRHHLVGSSKKMLDVLKTIEKYARSSANVIITGETGTGKEVVARNLRTALPDGSLAPFVAIDSATIQSTTAESILFGHEKGAFTGAEKTTKGIFEEANGGIVYFDEIGNMPLEIQAKLLRILQEKEVVRLGSSKPIELSFRVVCATNKNLEEMVRQGQFKDDLLQRLNVLPIHLPSLRERREDIQPLVEHFVRLHSNGSQPIRFLPEAIEVLQSYPWPGNIRELSNVVAYLLATTESEEIDIADLPPKIRDSAALVGSQTVSNSGDSSLGGNFYKRVESFEKELLEKEYNRVEGNISKLALELGMDRSHLYSKLRQYGIHVGRPKKS